MDEQDKKKRCWACGSLEVIRWDKQLNKQRFHCKNCGIFFSRNDPLQRKVNRFVWFRKWILERQTLSRDSGLSSDTLQRIFYAFLEEAPKVMIIQRSKVHCRGVGE